jgi:outer membrane protein assembly factor BamB
MLNGKSAVLVLVSVCLLSTADAADWPRFRGPNGTGIADDKDIPVRWDMNKNVLWKVPIPGQGNSSPVVWNNRLFLQTGNKEGTERILLCLDVGSGATVWTAKMPGNVAKKHTLNTFASSSPAVDRDRAYVVFWDGNNLSMHAYNHDGKPVWTKELGKFTGDHGAGNSPIVFEDKIFFANDQDGKAVLLCLDAKTGNEVWHADRPFYRACYSTPLLRDLPSGKKELVVVSTKGITGYDPDKGTQNWNWIWKFYTKKGELRTTSSPILAHGILFACSGDGGGDRHMVAVTLGEKPALAWENRKDFPYVPCLLVHGDYLYFVNDKGFAGCFHAKTGNRCWLERLGGDCLSSPVLIDGKIYSANDDGDVFVIEPTPTKLNVLAKNSLGEIIRASPAVADNRLFIRGQKHLFCIGKAK